MGGKFAEARSTLIATVSGGTAVAAVALSPMLGLGALSVIPLGPQALSSGLVAAFVSATLGALCITLVSRAPGEVSGPRASMAIIYAALCADLVAKAGADTPSVIAALSLAVFLMGLLQLFAGCLRLGETLKFLPYPVAAGFITGTGLLVIWTQLGVVVGVQGGIGKLDWSSAFQQIKLLGVLIGAASAATVWVIPRFTTRVQPVLAGFVAGTALYQLAGLFAGPDLLGPTLGVLEPLSIERERLETFWPSVGWVWFADTAVQVLPYAGLLALQGSLDSVLASRAVSEVTQTPPNIRRTLIAQGCGNMLSGALAGLPISTLVAQSVSVARMGSARTTVPWASCVILLLAIFLFGHLLTYIPAVVLAGLLLTIGVGLIDQWIRGLFLQILRGADSSGEMKWNLAVVVAVAGAMFAGSVPLALLVGTVLAMFILARSVSGTTTFLSEQGTRFSSRRVWPAEQARSLASLRASVRVLRPRGGLFFGTAERLAAALAALEPQTSYCVIDCSQLTVLDATGCRIISTAARKLAARGAVTLIAGLDPSSPREKVFANLGLQAIARDRWFIDLDHALEWVEAELLRKQSPPVVADSPVDLTQTDIARGLSGAELALLQSRLQPTEFAAGAVLFRSGAPGDSMFVIARGLVEIRIETDAGNSHSRTLAAIGPGCVFGEIAMLTSGARTADAVCVNATRLYELRRESLLELAPRAPEAYAKILANLNRHLAVRLIAATELAREA